MKKYNIYASIKNSVVEYVETNVEFEDESQALMYAKHCAYDLYYMNPKRDVLEIERFDDVDEDTAQIIFTQEMANSISYRVEEVKINEQ